MTYGALNFPMLERETERKDRIHSEEHEWLTAEEAGWATATSTFLRGTVEKSRNVTTERRMCRHLLKNLGVSLVSGYLPLYASALNPVTSAAAALRRDGGSRIGQALNVKANSRSNKCDLIIIYLERRRSSIRAWLRLTRVAEPGRCQRLLLFLRLSL